MMATLRAQRREAFYRRVGSFLSAGGVCPPHPQECRGAGAPPDAIRAMLNWGIERGEIVGSEGLYSPPTPCASCTPGPEPDAAL